MNRFLCFIILALNPIMSYASFSDYSSENKIVSLGIIIATLIAWIICISIAKKGGAWILLAVLLMLLIALPLTPFALFALVFIFL